MRYRVTWSFEVEAEDQSQARAAAREFLVNHDDRSPAKIAIIKDDAGLAGMPYVKAPASGVPAPKR